MMAKKIKTFVENYPVLTYWILAIILVLVMIPFEFRIFTHYSNFGADIDAATNGKGYNTNILYSLPIAFKVSGGIFVAFILLYLPATATISAIITSLILKGKQGVNELFENFRFWSSDISKREGRKIWGQAILMILVVKLILTMLTNVVDGVESAAFFEIQSKYTLTEFTFILLTSLFFDGGGLMEEIGWRGFALPRLQNKFSPLKASIILGVMWSLWHIPVKLNISPLPDFIAYYFSFTISCILLSIIIVFFYNKLGGSILIAVAIHGLFNDSAGIGGIFSTDNDIMPSLVYNTLQILILAGVVLFILYKDGPMLGRKISISDKITT